MPDRAPRGAAVSDRVSDNAVGRHSSFLRARVVVASDTSLRAPRKDDAGAPEGCAGRPGLGISVRDRGRGVTDGRGLRTPSRITDTVTVLGPLSSNPGLRARASAPPLGVFPSRGLATEIGRNPPLERNDLDGLRRSRETRSPTRSPRGARSGILRSGAGFGGAAW